MEPVKNTKKSMVTLQGINISHLGKRKIIFKMAVLGDMLVSWRVPLSVYKGDEEKEASSIGDCKKLIKKDLVN